MNGGGGFRGRGFSHGHHHQGPNGPGPGPSSRPVGLDGRSSGPWANVPRNDFLDTRTNIPGDSRPNDYNSRCIAQTSQMDGPNMRLDRGNLRSGGPSFRGGATGHHGPRPNFNLPRHQPRPVDNWTPRNGPPNFTPWRGGRPTRFNGPPRPFYRGRGNYGQYRYPYMQNHMGPLVLDFPPIPEPKPATPHLGSEEERLQKITEAADELKRKLLSVSKEPDSWYNDNDDDAVDFTSNVEFESRIANRGIPELKHDPPELNLTLNDLRDIGRVDNDLASKQAKANDEKASNSSCEEEGDPEVEILDYTPTETAIEIDLWSDDNFVEFEDEDTNDKSVKRPTEELPGSENTSLAASTNQDSQERRKDEKGEDKSAAKGEKNEDTDRILEKTSGTSDEKISDKIVENKSILQEESKTKNNEKDVTKSCEDDVNCTPSVKQKEATSTVDRNENETSQDKKIEDVRLIINDVNVNKSIIESSEESMLIKRDNRVDKRNAIKNNLGREIRQSDESRHENNSKESVDVTSVENDKPTAIKEPTNSAAAIAANETKASVKQMSRESEEATRKHDSRHEIPTDVRKHDTQLDVTSQKASSQSRSDKKSSLSIDNEKNKTNQKQNAITSKIDSDERQQRKEIPNEARHDRNREESPKGRSKRAEQFINKNNSNSKTEAREKTEISAKTDAARETDNIQKSGSTYKTKDDRGSPSGEIERRKNVRKMPHNMPCPRSRKPNRLESPSNSPQPIYDPRELPQSRIYGQNMRMSHQAGHESPINQIPAVFDPRLSTMEREALINSAPLASSSMVIQVIQDFAMAQSYPPCPMTNFAPNLPQMNYGAPRPPMISGPHPPLIGPPGESPICLPDPYNPILSLPSMPASIPLPAEAPMMLQPPLPAEPPPPPPPPAKSNFDMVDELEDMQEAMEFAKKFMNMSGAGEIGIVDDYGDSGFFHMPTFPDLPPIDLPPLPPPEIPSQSRIPEMSTSENLISQARRDLSSKDYVRSTRFIKQKPKNYESHNEKTAENDESMRPKVAFNLSPQKTKLSKPDAWQQQEALDKEEGKPRMKLSALLATLMPTKKENSPVANGHEVRETPKNDENISRFNGVVNIPPSTKPEEIPKIQPSHSPAPTGREKNSKDDDSRHSTSTDPEIIEQSSRRIVKDSLPKKTAETVTPESSWKNRVIGRFLKMSKNDIRNMLNNTSLRKFDIAMNHLVKERRSSLSLGMRSNEEEKTKGPEVSYDREEFMDQLSAMLDPSATVDVCNLPTQFIHHLSEVLQLDSLTEFESALTPTESMESASPTPVQPSPSLRRMPRAPSANVKEIDDRSRPVARGREDKSMNTCVTLNTAVATTPSIAPTSTAVARKTSTRTCDESVETRCVNDAKSEIEETNTNRATIGPRVRRRRVHTTIVEEVTDSTIVNNGSSIQKYPNTPNIANLDDILMSSIVGNNKKIPNVAGSKINEKRIVDINLTMNKEDNNEANRDPCADRVEQAAVELDKIFTAGIARFKLPSTKAAATKVSEGNHDDEDDEEENWNFDDRNTNVDNLHNRERSMGHFGSRSDKWRRKKAFEDRDAFRNLTKEEWEAKYGETSYSSYEQEYRVAMRTHRNDYEPSPGDEEVTGIKSRLGKPIPGNSRTCEAWSDSNDDARFRNANDPMDFDINTYDRSSGNSSSSSSMSTSSSGSSESEDEDSSSVSRLLKVIKAKEKIAKTKSINEEIRDEVAAEIEMKRREREKLHKSRHKSRLKKGHRRRKDRKEKKKKGHKRKKRRSRRSGSDSRESSGDEDFDDYALSSSRSRKSHSRILTENEIKKEIVSKDETERELSKSSLMMKITDESRPVATVSSSSPPAAWPNISPSPASPQLKTKGQLKQLPPTITTVLATPVVSKEIPKSQGFLRNETKEIASKEISKIQGIPVNEAKEISTKIVAVSPAIAEKSPIVSEATKSPIPSSSSSSVSFVPSVLLQRSSNKSEEVSTATKSIVKKLDFKEYMARNRQRQMRETEECRRINENPSILTQNLLNIPQASLSLVRNKDEEKAETNVTPMESLKLHSSSESLDQSKSSLVTNSTSIPTIVSVTSSACTSISTTPIASTNIPATSPQISISTKNPTKMIPTTSVTQKIISTTTIPATINPAIDATSVTVTGDSKLLTRENTPPKKLVRRRSVSKTPTMTAESMEEAGKFAHIKSEGGKEMKLREKPKKINRRPSAEALESTIPPSKLVRRRSIVPSETAMDKRVVIPSEKCIKEQATDSSDKRNEEPAASTSEKLPEKPAKKLAEESSDERTKESEKLKEQSEAIIPKESEVIASKKHKEEPNGITSLKPNEESAALSEKSTESSEQSAKETAKISEESPENPECFVSEKKIQAESKSDCSDIFKSVLKSDGFPDTVPQEHLQTVYIPRKLVGIRISQSDLDPLALPITELSGWPLEEGSISPNFGGGLTDSSEDPPFRGFTKDSIILHDRVLTEAEGDSSGTDDLGTVSLTFADDPEEREGGDLDLDDVTSTGVSLEAPVSYGDEEFVESGVETSLLGFPVENEMTDVTESINLGSENDLVAQEVDKQITKLSPEDLSNESTEIISRVAEKLKDSQVPEDFVIASVVRQQSIPSPLLVAENVGVEPKKSPDLSLKDNIDIVLPKENIDCLSADAAEVGTSREIENKDKTNNGFFGATQLSEKMGSLQSSSVPGEKELYFQMEKLAKIVQDQSTSLSEYQAKDISSMKNTTVNPSPTPRETPSEPVEETNKENAMEQFQSVAETREFVAKTKESQHSSTSSTKEHSHGRSKKKSSKHHNHSTKFDKKSTITEKMVAEAISANIVKVVPNPSSKATVLARMLEIDVEIHKLMNEKMTLHTMLLSGVFPSNDRSEEVSSNNANDETKPASDREEKTTPDIALPTVLASCLVRNLDKTVPVTPSKTQESKKSSSEIEGKTKKRHRSPQQRETKQRDKDNAVIESRRETKDSESKSSSTRTASEDSSRQGSTSTHSREKSTSSNEHEDTEENRRKRKTKKAESSKRHSSKEDLRDASRESSERSEKSSKRDNSPNRDKAKKKSKTVPEAKKNDEESKKVRKLEEDKPKQTEKIGSVIYSDESTWDSLDPDSTQSDEQRGKKEAANSCTGLALLEETFKREMAQTRKIKAVERRKNKKQELRRVALNATTFTTDDEALSLNNVKNPQKKGLQTSTENKGKSTTSGTSNENPAKILKHITSIIDAVAADRVEQLYTRETSPDSNDSTTVTATSIQSGDAEVTQERTSSISALESTGSGTNETFKKSKSEDLETTLQREADSKKSDHSESGKDVGSKKLEESKKPEEIRHSKSGSERSSPAENHKKIRSHDTSSNKNTSKSRNINVSSERTSKSKLDATGKKEDNEKSFANILKPDKKTESPVIKEKKDKIRETSRSPPPELSSKTKPRSRSVEKKHEVKEKQGQKRESSIDEKSMKSEESELVHHLKNAGKRARSNSRSDRSSKRRSVTPRDMEKDKDKERKERNSSRAEERDDSEEKTSGRPRSATKRRQREKSIPLSRRSSRYSEDSFKSSRSKKRDRERSESRGTSPHDSESSRKKSHNSRRSSSPKIQAKQSDDQSHRRVRKRKCRPEITRQEMMDCKVQLIDCKYTYLSPNMHPRVLKKFGITKINPYVPPTLIVETSEPPQIARTETPSPPALSKVEEAPKETTEEQSSPKDNHNQEEEFHGHGDEENAKDKAKDEDGVDETIHIVKAVENTENTNVSEDDNEVDAPEIVDEVSCSTETAPQDVIAVEDDTTEEIDQKTYDEVELIEEKAAASTSVEKSTEESRKSPDSEVEEDSIESRTRYTVHKGPILDIKVLDDSFLAASEDGAIYRYSQTSNGILNIYKGHEAAVTCIHVLEMSAKRWNLYSGSLDGTFRCYDITTGVQERPPADVGSAVQCMDQAWGIIFVGTKSGHISRYNIKSGSIKGDRLEFSDQSVLALKASTEGPRRVLIVAARNQPITIRDALTGLYLRTICGYKNHTVYSLMRERNLVYCGTSSTSIPVFDFTNGEQVTQYNAGVGIVCMRLYRQILFAGCYDGNIYVFDTKDPRLIVSIPGPGNMLLSMEVVGDEIIAGSKNRQLHSWRMPKQVRAVLSERS